MCIDGSYSMVLKARLYSTFEVSPELSRAAQLVLQAKTVEPKNGFFKYYDAMDFVSVWAQVDSEDQ